MKTLNIDRNKKAKAFLDMWKKSTYQNISQVYNTHSTRKEAAQNYCLTCMSNEGGWSFRILTWNTFHFTCAWMTKQGLRVETAQNS